MKLVFVALLLVSSGFINQRDNANLGECPNQRLALFCNMLLLLLERASLPSRKNRLTYLRQNSCGVAKCGTAAARSTMGTATATGAGTPSDSASAWPTATLTPYRPAVHSDTASSTQATNGPKGTRTKPLAV